MEPEDLKLATEILQDDLYASRVSETGVHHFPDNARCPVCEREMNPKKRTDLTSIFIGAALGAAFYPLLSAIYFRVFL